MKIATSMYGFREHDLMPVLDFCAEAGISGIEAGLHPQQFRCDMTDAELAGIQGELRLRRLTLEALALSNDFTVSAEKIGAEVDRVIAGLNLARRLGVRRARIFAGWTPPECMDDQVWDRMVKALRCVARHASAGGIRLGLENHGGITATAADVARILDRTAIASLGLLYDPANFVRSGEDCLRALETMRTRLVYTHAKDLTRMEGGAVCPLGQGIMPWRRIIRELMPDPESLVVIEQTDPKDIFQATRQSAEALREICLDARMGSSVVEGNA